MTTDECARIEELISAMQDNAATPEEVARVERHIAGCARCRATAAAYQRVDQQVRRYIMATPVPEIAAPWRNEPLIVPVRRGGAGLGHWRITLVGLATHALPGGPPAALVLFDQAGGVDGGPLVAGLHASASSGSIICAGTPE